MRHNTFLSRIHYQGYFVQQALNPDTKKHHESLFCSKFAHLIHALASELDSTNS